MTFIVNDNMKHSITVYGKSDGANKFVDYIPRVILPVQSMLLLDANVSSFFSATDARNNPMQRKTFVRSIPPVSWIPTAVDTELVMGCMIANLWPAIGTSPNLFAFAYSKGKMVGTPAISSIGAHIPETVDAKQVSVVCDRLDRVWLFVGLSTNQVKVYVFPTLEAFWSVDTSGVVSYVLPGPAVDGSAGAAPWSVAMNDFGMIMVVYAQSPHIYERHIDTNSNIVLASWSTAQRINVIEPVGIGADTGSVTVEGGPSKTFHVAFQMATNAWQNPPAPAADTLIFYQRTTDNGTTWMSRENLVCDTVIAKTVCSYFGMVVRDNGDAMVCTSSPTGRSPSYVHIGAPQSTPLNGSSAWLIASNNTIRTPTYVEPFMDSNNNFGELIVRLPSVANGNLDGGLSPAVIMLRKIFNSTAVNPIYPVYWTETVLQTLPMAISVVYNVHNIMPLVFMDGRRRISETNPRFFHVTKNLNHWAGSM